jgi:hypothetical protein
MLLMIDHLTLYRYETPARGVVQSHRLMPSTCAGQEVVAWEVTVSGGVKGGGFRDGAGDLGAGVERDRPCQRNRRASARQGCDQ